jgi:hypothetical protein
MRTANGPAFARPTARQAANENREWTRLREAYGAAGSESTRMNSRKKAQKTQKGLLWDDGCRRGGMRR